MCQLSEASQDYLLRISRVAIQTHLVSGIEPFIPPPTEKERFQKRGAFVTLYHNKRLRGCVGYVQPVTPLFRVVTQCSVSAAVEDKRFPPLKLRELSAIEIELSVLSALQEVKNPLDIEIGRHGLLISHEAQQGLLLPQVAVEHGWKHEQFLEQTCRKAGLQIAVWRNGARLQRFTTTVFREKERRIASLT